jgi:DNA modification methylase
VRDPYWRDPSISLLLGNSLEVLRELPDECVQTVVTSPPYFGLRDYGIEPSVWGGDAGCEHVWGEVRRIASGNAPSGKSTLTTNNGRGPLPGDKYHEANAAEASTGQFCECGVWLGALGLEPTPELFVQHMVEVFREVRRVLAKDGTLWLVIGDTYAANRTYQVPSSKGGAKHSPAQVGQTANKVPPGFKPKDLILIPFEVASALRENGWYLRADVIWHKPNAMPQSAKDRPTLRTRLPDEQERAVLLRRRRNPGRGCGL